MLPIEQLVQDAEQRLIQLVRKLSIWKPAGEKLAGYLADGEPVMNMEYRTLPEAEGRRMFLREILQDAFNAGRNAANSQWMPIETAPKDGMAVLVLAGPWKNVVEGQTYHQPAQVAICHWDAARSTWVEVPDSESETAYRLQQTGRRLGAQRRVVRPG
jgi:hypothetical protein